MGMAVSVTKRQAPRKGEFREGIRQRSGSNSRKERPGTELAAQKWQASGARNFQRARWISYLPVFHALPRRGNRACLCEAPDKRIALFQKANENLQTLAFRWETERQTPKGDTIRPLIAQRDARTREQEERWFQASRREELEAAVYAKHAEVFANEGRGSIWSGPVMSALSKPGDRLHGRIK